MREVARVTRFSGPRVVEVRSIFSPLALVILLYVPLLALYAVSSPTVFALDFQSRKTLSWSGAAFFVIA